MSARDLEAVIAEKRALHDAATPGPWETWETGDDVRVLAGVEKRTSCSRTYAGGGHQICELGRVDYDQDDVSSDEDDAHQKMMRDARSIAAARTDLPAALNALEAVLRSKAYQPDSDGSMVEVVDPKGWIAFDDIIRAIEENLKP